MDEHSGARVIIVAINQLGVSNHKQYRWHCIHCDLTNNLEAWQRQRKKQAEQGRYNGR